MCSTPEKFQVYRFYSRWEIVTTIIYYFKIKTSFIDGYKTGQLINVSVFEP